MLHRREISGHPTALEHLRGHAGHGHDACPIGQGGPDRTGVGQRVTGRGDDHLLLTHQGRHGGRRLLSVMPALWHQHEQDPVGSGHRGFVQGSAYLCRGWIADDQDVFVSPDVHARGHHGQGACCQVKAAWVGV